jgi:hypothetical protein
MDGGELAATGQLGQSSMVVGVASGGARAPRTAPVEALIRRGDNTSSGGCGGLGLDGNGELGL